MESLDKDKTPSSLRLGYVTNIFYHVSSLVSPKQLDLLNDWFPNLIISEQGSDRTEKKHPEFVDTERIIKATRYHDYLYSGGNNRVTYITGKLVGTASSNLEKERKSAELIQKNISRRLVEQMDTMDDLCEHVGKRIATLSEDQLNELADRLEDFIFDCAGSYYKMSEYERDKELFPFDEEVFDQIIYNAFYQLLLGNTNGLANAYLWLLLGSLLRNECGRICRVFDSSFAPIYKATSENGTLLDKLNYLMHPEEYELYYAGDDLDSRFPGISWICDGCDTLLNDQEGFDDHFDVWQCRKCGHLNKIGLDNIDESEEDRKHGIKRKRPEEFLRAINERKKDGKK